MDDNQIIVTEKMRKSVEIEGNDSHKVITFEGVNGDFIRIYDESKNPDSQVVEIEISKRGYGFGNTKNLMMTTADFDLMLELMYKPLKK